MRGDEQYTHENWRFYVIVFIIALVILGIVMRMVYLTVIDRSFLKKEGNARSLRVVSTPAYRGMILDRNGHPLAISTPVDSVWLNPQDFPVTLENVSKLAGVLSLPSSQLLKVLAENQKKQFIYIKRGVPPAIAKKIKALKMPGVYLQRMYRRYYPDGAVTAHLVGFTNIDNKGQAGVELANNRLLRGTLGKTLVEQNRYGKTVAVLKEIQAQKPGKNLVLSIDQRIQFITYKVLQATIKQFNAKSASAVVLNVKTGEVLAMVSLPSFNPNSRPKDTNGRYRYRAITDVYEPGSVMKTFAEVSALDSGKFTPETKIDTHPGWFYVGRNRVRDENVDHGILTLTGILQKSSNVGIAKVTLASPPEQLWGVLHRVGFGQTTGIHFPGEQNGSLVNHRVWAPISLATLAFGYGVSANVLQLARAYAVIADGGILRPATLLKQQTPTPGHRVISQQVAGAVLKMLASVVNPQGTGFKAAVAGYHVGGKTGTSRVAIPGGYSKTEHIATFVGVAPISNPRLIIVVKVDDPKKSYYASYVAAPAFSKIMGGALRLLNVPPDNLATLKDPPKNRRWVAPV